MDSYIPKPQGRSGRTAGIKRKNIDMAAAQVEAAASALLAKLDESTAALGAADDAELDAEAEAQARAEEQELVTLRATVRELEAQLSEEDAQMAQLKHESEKAAAALEATQAARNDTEAQMQQRKRSAARQQGTYCPAWCVRVSVCVLRSYTHITQPCCTCHLLPEPKQGLTRDRNRAPTLSELQAPPTTTHRCDAALRRRGEPLARRCRADCRDGGRGRRRR